MEYNCIRSRLDEYPSWPEYVIDFDVSTRFGNMCDDLMSDMVNLKQGESVDEFLDTFESSMNMLDLPSAHALSLASILLSNIYPHLEMHVK